MLSNRQLGGLRASEKNKARNPKFYEEIGAMGGKLSEKTYLRNNRDVAVAFGKKGGSSSKKGHKLIRQDNYWRYYTETATGKEVAFSKASNKRKEME